MFELYLEHEYHLAAAQLALAMLGVGATVTAAQLVSVFRFPGAFALGMAVQLLLVPAVAVLVGWLLGVGAGVATGLVLVAAVPGGTLSNLVSYVARANLALSVSLTAVSTLGCLVTTPLVLRLLAAAHLPEDFAMPAGRIALEIAVCLLGPLAVGMMAGARLGEARMLLARWAIRTSFALIVVIVVGSAGAGRIDPAAEGVRALAGLAAFAVLIQAGALALGRALRLPAADRAAIAIEVTIRNTNLGLLLKASLFPAVPGVADPLADGVLFVVLLYGGFALPAVLPVTVLQRRARPPAPLDPRRRARP
jgi:BASS family bile acid:Na+ symporter